MEYGTLHEIFQHYLLLKKSSYRACDLDGIVPSTAFAPDISMCRQPVGDPGLD